MRLYELMYITDPRIAEDAREAGVEKVKKVIVEKLGAKIEHVDRWGIRKLAYKLPKTKLTEGDYTVVLFRSDGKNMNELLNLFQVTPEFVRKQIVRREDLEKKERKEILKARMEKAGRVEEEDLKNSDPSLEANDSAEPKFNVEDK